jgi:DNA-binding transcriptional regulator/RsmH inhibitor MraZ
VAFDRIFSGNAAGAVGADGTVGLPLFIRRVIETGAGTGRLMVGAHEADPCLTAWEPRQAIVLQAEIERRRLRDESVGAAAADHHHRARRAFGMVEDAPVDGGTLALPAMMRRKARIGARVLFVGTGSGFEIWNADEALTSADPGVREIARFRLEDDGEGEMKQ